MKTLLLCWLFLILLSAVAQGQVPVALVMKTTPGVTMRPNPADEPRKLRVGNRLPLGAKVECPANESLTLKWPDGVVKSYGSNALEVIAIEAENISYIRTQDIEQTYVAGRSRGEGSLLYAPANGTRVRTDEPLELRWIPSAEGGEVGIEVWAASGQRPLWKKNAPDSAGRLMAPDLPQRLMEAAAGGETRFFFVLAQAGRRPTPEQTNECGLLPPAAADALARELNECGPSKGPWYHLLRAAAFKRHQITHAAFAEFEAAFDADPVHAANREVVQRALELAEQIGNWPRAKAFKATLDRLPE